MGLIRSGDYDINSLAAQLGVPQAEAYDLYNNYLSDTFGLSTYDRAYDPGLNLDDQAIEALNQQYFNVANQQGYSPEEMSRIFGRPLDQTRDYLSKGYFSDIPVDADYSTDEAQKVYDLYKSGRIGATGISNYFGIPSDDVQRILGEIDTAGGIVAAPSPATDSKVDTAPAVTPIEDINPLSIGLDLYESTGDVLPENQIREIFEYAQDENISYSQLDEMFGQPAGTAQNAAAALGMAASAGGIVGMAKGSQFPDFSGDGEITQKDILIGKGVVEKKMREGRKVDDLTLLQKIRQKISQGMMNTGSDMQESDRIYREDMAPFLGKGPAITKEERALLRSEAEKDPTFIGRLGEFLEGLGESVGGEKEEMASGGVVGYQDGGYVNRDELDSLIKMTSDAILGDAENADEVIETFISVFGNEAFQQLRDQVLQAQVPDAQTEGMIEGEGGGMDDEVMGMIGNQQRVAVSPGEYIVPADVVASLGDGSSDAGADKLDTMLDDVRVAKTGRTIQPGKIDDRVMPA
jgi:Spy/CpxP family protein refolding chaperone